MRIPGQLDRYDKMAADRLVAAMGERLQTHSDLHLQLGVRSWPNFAIWTDDELHELIYRDPVTRDALMAQAEGRRRERWDGPARWSLGVSIVAVVI